MVKKKASNQGETRTCFMFPEHHEDVAKATSPLITCNWIQKKVSDRSAHREYTTYVMGKFRCMNTTCAKKGWSSKMIAITIRGYAKNGYNAVIFNQRCKICHQLGTLFMDKTSYVDRVAYRLHRWAGVQVEQPYYASKKGLPHKRELCEGCKRGVCRQTNDWEQD